MGALLYRVAAFVLNNWMAFATGMFNAMNSKIYQMLVFMGLIATYMLGYLNSTIDLILSQLIIYTCQAMQGVQIDYSGLTPYLDFSGPALTVMNAYFPFAEAVLLTSAYYAWCAAIWYVRMIIKIAPFIG